jgi:hypothetical protein
MSRENGLAGAFTMRACLSDTSTTMSTTPPDRLSNDPRSKFYDESVLERGIGIRFNGVERHNVEEYCISEGWVRLPVGKALDRHGQPMTMKVKGQVEAWFLTPDAQEPAAQE